MRNPDFQQEFPDKRKGTIPEEQHSLADGVFDSLPVRSQSLSFLPSHFHQHLVSDVFHGQLEFLVLGIIRLPALLQRGKSREKGGFNSMDYRRVGKKAAPAPSKTEGFWERAARISWDSSPEEGVKLQQGIRLWNSRLFPGSGIRSGSVLSLNPQGMSGPCWRTGMRQLPGIPGVGKDWKVLGLGAWGFHFPAISWRKIPVFSQLGTH